MASLKLDNIFDTLTDNQEVSNELQARADLMLVIRDIANVKGWKQADAAKKLDLIRKPSIQVDNP